MRQLHPKHRCSGSSMVEMAIVVIIFFGLVFAIIEFALVTFYANRLVDATRSGARHAVVSAPLIGDLGAYTCGTLPSDYTACDSTNAACMSLSRVMSATVPIDVGNINYKYQCTQIGSDSVARVFSVSIKVVGMKYVPVLPNLIVMNDPSQSAGAFFEIDMPEYETTRTSEDQFGND